jgi:hypothetical protein
MQITSDGNYLLFPSYETVCSLESAGMGRGNVLHHFDLVQEDLLAETCLDASFASLVLTSDNEYAYITDRALRRAIHIFPSGILRRYHLRTLNVEDYIDFSQFEDASGGYSPALEYIALSPDDNTAVVTSGRSLMIVDLAARTLKSKLEFEKKLIAAIYLGKSL